SNCGYRGCSKNKVYYRSTFPCADYLSDRSGNSCDQKRSSAKLLEAFCNFPGKDTHCHSFDCTFCKFNLLEKRTMQFMHGSSYKMLNKVVCYEINNGFPEDKVLLDHREDLRTVCRQKFLQYLLFFVCPDRFQEV